MKIVFTVNYRTNWGESLHIYGDIPELGCNDPVKAIAMEMVNASTWRVSVEVPMRTRSFAYRYVVKAENRAWRFEWGMPHTWRQAPKVQNYTRTDAWHDMPADKPFYSSAFTDGILARHNRAALPKVSPGAVEMKVFAPMVMPDEELCIAGSAKALGEWNVAKALPLSDAEYPLWQTAFPFAGIDFPFEYKFLIRNKQTGNVVVWENCANRVMNVEELNPDQVLTIDGLHIANPRYDWKGAGTAIPVFSLRTHGGFGVGDFLDLIPMVDWCAMTGQKVLQLLPVNDTTMTGTWTDSYPYNANSTFALHPLYLNLKDVGKLRSAQRQKYFDELRHELNGLDKVDYERVTKAKSEFMHEIYAEKKVAVFKSKAYKEFVNRNIDWLRPYAVFCCLRDQFGTPDMNRWGDYATYDRDKVNHYCAEHDDEVHFYYFEQYFLDRQLRKARDYAHSKGVILKGDIPIGISRTSVDAWQYPRLFNLDSQAGAPPDAFSTMGQNWGFPTYNWDEMAKDGFAWWKARFRKMSEYFDAYRIDHILGFFRIWQIPMDAIHGLLGIFNPALPFTPEEMRHDYDFWIDVDLHTNPLVMEWMLTDFFGPYAQEAKEKFLEPIVDGRYRLREFVNTQRKVADYFAAQPKDEKNERLCNALLGLIDDVLFIEDPYKRGTYHPRISAQYTYQYRRLNDYEKSRFDTLYNDFFYRRNNDFWQDKAMWKLPPLLDSTSMLTCAEDLGMIPDCVPYVMNTLEILSLEIQRMPKNPRHEFGDTWHYPYYSVCTTSTHDMPGIRGWWEEDHSVSQRYYNNVLGHSGEAPYYAEPWICAAIVSLNLKSPSMLCILPLQDWLSTDGGLRRNDPREEQINIPAISRHYWRYRMHIAIEELMKQSVFNQTVNAMIRESGR